MDASTGTPSVWLVTGARTGIGREIARLAHERGDRVVELSRSLDTDPRPDDDDRVLRLRVDVSDRAAVFDAVAQAIAAFGRLDVVVNNAGTMTLGCVEEFTEAEAREQFETNLFGALWVSQAVLPAFRAQGSGRLIQISSIGGVLANALTGLYSASKFALEGLSEALASEAAEFGACVTIVEPGGYWTELYTDLPMTEELPAYAGLRERIAAEFAGGSDSHPRLAAVAIREIAEADAPPRRLLLGGAVYDAARSAMEERMRDWAANETISRAAEDPIPDPRG